MADSEPNRLAGELDTSQDEQAAPQPPAAEAAEPAEPPDQPADAPDQTAGPPDQPAGPQGQAAEKPGQAAEAPDQAAEAPDQSAGGRRGRRRRRAGGARRRFSWRTPVSALLIVIGCVFAPLSVIGVWSANQVSDTNRYVENIGPLIHEPAVQNALTDKITTAITSKLNVTGYADQAAAALDQKGLSRVSSLLKSVAPSLASGVAGYIHNAVHKIVTGPRFERAWIQVNTQAHQRIDNVLSGRSTAVSTKNGQVVLDLAPLIDVAKQDLAARGFTLVNKLPPIHPTFALFSAKYLDKAQAGYRLINDLKIVLPILTLLLLAAGVFVARRRRRALIGAGLGFAASMLVLGLALLLARSIYLSSVPSNVLSADAASVIFDTFVRFIKTALRTLLVLGLVVALGAFFTGPSAAAVRTRGAFKSGFDRIRGAGESHGVSTGPVGQWTYAHRMALRIAAVTLAALIFVFWGRPTAAVVIWLAVLLVVVLGLIELIGRPPARAEAESPP
jgi:hypothetical protein